MKNLAAILVWLAVGLGLTVVFWGEFWQGKGLIGGDIYSYFFPQKTFYAKHIQQGEFPLWNNWVGHGYPLIAESQTGVFYPPNYLAYRWFSVSGAYQGLQLFHYALAFVFCVALGRALKFSIPASALLGLVFVYGWFPARITLEWGILTGAWIPAAIYFTEKLMASGRWRFAGGLAIVLALQMLPGHFHLAFITQVLVVGYALGRVWFSPADQDSESLSENSRRDLGRRFGVVLGAMLIGFGLAAVQLLPTWELKVLSQRSSAGSNMELGSGHIPVWYWSQLVAPFLWYGTSNNLNASLPPGSPGTNAVEAHLYFGLIPFALLIYGIFTGVFWRDRRWRLWGLLLVLTLFYATGWLLPLTKSLPGFHFFHGLGRWGIVTTLAAAILSASALDALLSNRRSRFLAVSLSVLVLGLTVLDLRIVRGLVGDGVFVENPPINHREHSPIGNKLKSASGPVRLFCRGPNLPTLLEVSSTPTYLGLGPDAYFDPKTKLPEPLPFDDPPTPAQIEWLQHAGVTHVLSFTALENNAWPVTFLMAESDPFLCRAWGRGPQERMFLYELKHSRGRVAWEDQRTNPVPPKVRKHNANRVLVEAETTDGGTLILTELAYPGWEVFLNGEPGESLTIEGMYRGVELPAGKHQVEWIYRPQSLGRGIWISGLSLALLLGVLGLRWKRTREQQKTPADKSADERRAG